MNSQTTTSLPLDETEEATEILDGHLKQTSNRVAAYSSALREANEKNEDMPHIVDAMLTHSKKSSAGYYLNALRSATKAKQHDLVVQIDNHMAKNGVSPTQDMCEVILKSCASASDLETTLGVRSTMRCCGLEMTKSMTYSLVKCAAKADQWDAVIDIITDLRNGGTKPTMVMYTMGLNECSKRHRLDAAVDIYRVTPEEIQAQLVCWSLGIVIRGHALSDNKEVQLRAIDIMNEHESDGTTDDKKLTGAQASTAVNEPAVPSRGNARQEAVGQRNPGLSLVVLQKLVRSQLTEV
ncbi:hypothetical protein PHYPSEUDO_008664 [Phytophthora pseudosyringae]|uniref:Pentatricopeptide repeat-containing protein-mitochondrial domain-containing protein n=1 Tax=Phytophthora pseudosyringae TaxID=221518 RepID=A0A8T1VDS2_9STRA|nr:hypothetical protein PHYPSEUDO_008664 [Phytophthora pseudosyringae]